MAGNLKKLFDPKNPSSHIEGFPGCAVGYVLSVDDPERLGRVQVCCPVIEPDTPLPNDCDGWIPVGTEFTVKDGIGGKTYPISIGTQCILMPVLGLTESWIVFRFLSSRRSPLSAEFDPVRKIHGTVTGGGVYELHDEINLRSIKTYPNGLTWGISPNGDFTVQHDSGSRLNLRFDGSVVMENDVAHYGISPDGYVSLRNKNGAGVTLDKDGYVSMSVAGMSEVKLTPYGFSMTGQVDEVGQLKEALKQSFNGVMGGGQSYILRLQFLAEELRGAIDPYPVLMEIQSVLGELEALLAKTPEAKGVLSKLLAIAPSRLGHGVMGQIDRFRAMGLDKLIDKVLENGFEGITPGDIGSLLDQFVPSGLMQGVNIRPSQLIDVIEGLQTPGQRVDALLERVVPDGFGQIESLRGLGLIEQIPGMEIVRTIADMKLETLLAEIKLDGSTTATDLLTEVEDIANALDELLGTNINLPGLVEAVNAALGEISAIADMVLEEIGRLEALVAQVKSVIDDVSMATGFGQIMQEQGGRLLEGIEASENSGQGVSLLREFIEALIRLYELSDAAQITLLKSLAASLGRLTGIDFAVNSLDGAKTPGDLANAVDFLIRALSQQAIPLAILQVTNELSSQLLAQAPTYQSLLQILPTSRDGSLRQDGTGLTLGADEGGLGGTIKSDATATMVRGPGGDRGVGTNLELGTERIFLKTPGADKNLGSQVIMEPEKLSFEAPGAAGGLGASAEITKEGFKAEAPGAKKGVGGWFEAIKDKFHAFGPGGKLAAFLELTAEVAELSAPGPRNFVSTLALEVGKAVLRGPGGDNAPSLVIEPQKTTLALPFGPIFELENNGVAPIPSSFPQLLRLGNGGTILEAGNSFEFSSGTTLKTGLGSRISSSNGSVRLQSGTWSGTTFSPTMTFSVTPTGISLGMLGMMGSLLSMEQGAAAFLAGSSLMMATGGVTRVGPTGVLSATGGTISLNSGVWAGDAITPISGIEVFPGGVRLSGFPMIGLGGAGIPFIPALQDELTTVSPWLPFSQLIDIPDFVPAGDFNAATLVTLISSLAGTVNALSYNSLKDTPEFLSPSQMAIALDGLSSQWLSYSRLKDTPTPFAIADFSVALNKLVQGQPATLLGRYQAGEGEYQPIMLGEEFILDPVTGVLSANVAIDDGSITLDKLAPLPGLTVIGNLLSVDGSATAIALGDGFSFNGTTLSVDIGTTSTFLDDLVDVQLGNQADLVGGVLLGYDALINKWKPTSISVVVSVNGYAGTVTLYTDDIPEAGGVRYYTDARVDARVAQLSIDHLADVNKAGWAVNKVWGFDANGNTVPLDMAAIGGIGFTDLIDGNLGTPSNGQPIVWNSTQNKFVMGPVITITSTDDLPQGSNSSRRYYSDSYVSSWIAGQSVNVLGDVNTASSQDGQVLKRVNGVWQGADVVLPSSTDDLPQGSSSSRRYYSDSYVSSWIAGQSIDVFNNVDLTGWTTGQVLGFNSGGFLVPLTVLTGSTTTDAIAPGVNPARQYFSNSLFDARLAQSSLSALVDVGSNPPQGGYALVYDAATGLYQPGPTGTISVRFTYVSNGDDKGVVYWCGTEKRAKSFVSPGLKSAPFNITVSLSSNLPGTPTYHAIDRDGGTIVHTASQANSYVILDFGSDKLMKPTDYVIRGRSDSNSSHPRNWQIQGSADGLTNWITLDTQINNISVGVGTYYHGSCSATEAYRYLRILQTGINSSGTEYLVLSELEFYGYLTISGTSAVTSTDDLPQGDSHFYYSDALVQSYLDDSASISGSRLVANSVALSKLPALSLNQFWAKPTSGTGDAVTCTFGTGFSWDGTTLNVSGLGGVTSVVGETGVVTATQIATALNGLTGTDRVSYNSLKDTPTSFAPTGSAGGDLSGNYPNPAIASNAVTFAKFQQVASGTLLGRSTASTGNVEVITLGSGLTLSSGVLSNTVATFGSFYAASPTVKNIPLFTATRATTINELRGVITASGTATLSIQINGVNVTGLSNLSITSSSQNFTATGGNTVSVGARVTVNITAVSLSPPPADLEFTMGATLN